MDDLRAGPLSDAPRQHRVDRLQVGAVAGINERARGRARQLLKGQQGLLGRGVETGRVDLKGVRKITEADL